MGVSGLKQLAAYAASISPLSSASIFGEATGRLVELWVQEAGMHAAP